MTLEKIATVDRIEVLVSGIVNVHVKTVILENSTQISSRIHAHTIAPGDDYSAEDARVQAVCAATHTAEVVAAYAAEQAKNAPAALPEAEV
jgi:hypothetical protein